MVTCVYRRHHPSAQVTVLYTIRGVTMFLFILAFPCKLAGMPVGANTLTAFVHSHPACQLCVVVLACLGEQYSSNQRAAWLRTGNLALVVQA